MSQIVTFYSFKGGVGRSMALANVSVLLARRGLRVLAVDWDLEAPGLERYFGYFEGEIKRGGLLPFLAEQQARIVADGGASPGRYRDHLSAFHVGGAEPVLLLGSGRTAHADYARLLDHFSWRLFFERGGGDFLEQLRELWRAEFDVVLIDSRTGMSDAGGICTIQLPDVLVVMFTANFQSVLGVRDVVASAQRGRQELAYDRMALTVLPIASRFSRMHNPELAHEWIERFATELGSSVDDWLPSRISRHALFERLHLPHDDAFGFGERLAVVEQDDSALGGLRAGYERIAGLLASEFSDLEPALGGGLDRTAEYIPELKRSPPPREEYDVYVSYARDSGVVTEWIYRFVEAVQSELDALLGRDVRIALDVGDVTSGPLVAEALTDKLERSRVLLAILTPQYWASSWCIHEWQWFESREERRGMRLIVPVALRGFETFPRRIFERLVLDASHSLLSADDPSSRWYAEEAALSVARALEQTPAALPVDRDADRRASHDEVHRVLFLAANPVGLDPMQLEVEAGEIARELAASTSADRFAFETKLANRLATLNLALREIAPTVVHFSGYGSSDGLYLKGRDGLPELISPGRLRSVFKSATRTVKLVVLHGCYTEDQARALRAQVDCVVGIGPMLSESATRIFATELYSGLAEGLSINAAFERGRASLPPESWSEPRILARRGVDPADLHLVRRSRREEFFG